MKTAEQQEAEWSKLSEEVHKHEAAECLPNDWWKTEFIKFIKQIQLDAWKQGIKDTLEFIPIISLSTMENMEKMLAKTEL